MALVVDYLQYLEFVQVVDGLASHMGRLIRHSECAQVPLADHTADVGDCLDADHDIAMVQHESAGEAFLIFENVAVTVAH